MKCERAGSLMMPLADRELGPLLAWRASRHLATCARCAGEERALVELSGRLRAEIPRHRAPPELIAELRARLAPVARPDAADRSLRPSRRDRRRWISVGALAGSAATIALWFATTAVIAWHAANDLSRQLIVAHVQAVGESRLVAVASSDRHRLKPWLSARLDYSPPVQDLADAGFPLVGGRVEVVGGRRIAALVYRYRDHTIDVFVQPATSAATAVVPGTSRGYNLVTASNLGMDWAAVSDANGAILAELLRRLGRPPGVASP